MTSNNHHFDWYVDQAKKWVDEISTELTILENRALQSFKDLIYKPINKIKRLMEL